jgi:hypothetical protein
LSSFFDGDPIVVCPPTRTRTTALSLSLSFAEYCTVSSEDNMSPPRNKYQGVNLASGRSFGDFQNSGFLLEDNNKGGGYTVFEYSTALE